MSINGPATAPGRRPDPVAVIGVGNMGGGIARNLLRRGWPVHVHDVVPERQQALADAGAQAHPDPRTAALQARTSIVVVVTAEQADDVLFGPQGLAPAVPAGHTVLLCPTMAPHDVERLAARLHPAGVFCVDAPMSGGPARAEDGSMSLMVACAESVYVRQAELLSAMSSRLFRVGERLGDGARTKLVNNLAAATNLLGAAEALALARRLGLDPARTLDVMEQSSGQSWIGSDRMRRAIDGDFEPRAHLSLLEKDTRLAMEAADRAGFRGPLGAAVRDSFAAASASGLSDQDDGVLLRWLDGRR